MRGRGGQREKGGDCPLRKKGVYNADLVSFQVRLYQYRIILTSNPSPIQGEGRKNHGFSQPMLPDRV